MNEKGWIKAYRKIEDDPIICKDNDYFRVWFYLLLNATHKTQKVIFKNKEIIVPKGSLITGRKKIAEKCNISESKIDRILKLFEKHSKIEQQMSNKNRLIIIQKWYLYQKTEQQVNNNRATSEHKQECKNENNNSVFNNICHFEMAEKVESCFYCMKKNICKNPTSTQFLLEHNDQEFSEWDKQREKKIKNMRELSEEKIECDLEILDEFLAN